MRGSARTLVALVSVFLPWGIRRRILVSVFGYRIDPTARIGLSWVFPRRALVMGPNAQIGHLNVIKQVDEVELGEGALIGTMNWVTANLAGFEEEDEHESLGDRHPRLEVGPYSSVSTRHYFDCSDLVRIGEFSDVAGLRCVLLTHHMDIGSGRQKCRPIAIGPHCFISTNCVILGGASVPDHSIVAAGAVVVDRLEEPYRLYAGAPAREKKVYEPGTGWFARSRQSIRDSRSRWAHRPRLGMSGERDG